MFDLTDAHTFVLETAKSLGAEFASPWLYLQCALMLAAAGIAAGIGTLARARIDLTSLVMGWPAPLRMFMRVLVESISTAAFVVLTIVAREVMLGATLPSRSYLLAIAAKLALAWLVIRLVTSIIHNPFIVRLVSISAWFVAALSILGLLQPTITFLDGPGIELGGLRLTPLLVIKLAVLLAVARGWRISPAISSKAGSGSRTISRHRFRCC